MAVSAADRRATEHQRINISYQLEPCSSWLLQSVESWARLAAPGNAAPLSCSVSVVAVVAVLQPSTIIIIIHHHQSSCPLELISETGK